MSKKGECLLSDYLRTGPVCELLAMGKHSFYNLCLKYGGKMGCFGFFCFCFSKCIFLYNESNYKTLFRAPEYLNKFKWVNE